MSNVKAMNKNILFVMKWLKAPGCFTKEEVKANRKATDVDTAAHYAACYATTDTTDSAAEWVSAYFDRSSDDRSEYESVVKEWFLQGSLGVAANEIDGVMNKKPAYTQAMCDAGLPPLVSSSVIIALSYDELGERLGEFSGEEVDIIASTKLGNKKILTVSHYMLGVAAMCMNQGLFAPIDTRTTEQKQLEHVTHLVGSMSHLPAVETGKAIIDYLKG